MHVHHGGHDYYHHGHSWYEPYWHHGHFVYYPVYAPAGYFYVSLPPKHITIVINKTTYYEADGTYYTKGQKDGKDGYVVTEAPQEKIEPKVVDDDEDAPDPFKTLKASCDYLASRKQFKLVAREDVDEVLETGQKIQMSGKRTVAVQRPDRIAVTFEGAADKRNALYDGTKLTLISLTKNEYMQVPMPKTIDETLDTLAVQYGMVIPLGDLIGKNSYETLVAQVQTGQYIGKSIVSNSKSAVSCYHLAFTQESVDWEIWIQTGKTPVPRRLVITYKQVDGNPKYRLHLNNWQFEDIPAKTFDLEIPKDAIKVRVGLANTQGS